MTSWEAELKHKENEISLMFSGGVDSTMTAIMLSRQYDKVHLLTYGNGYGHFRLDRTRRRAEELQQKISMDKFTHTLMPLKDLFEDITVRPFMGDYRRYGSAFIWCMGCKLSMHALSILYNLEHGITRMSDGSSADTDEMVEQMTISLRLTRDFYARYGICYENPVYNMGRKEEIRQLMQMKFKMGFRVLDRFIGTQPRCIPGEVYYLPYVLLGITPDHQEEKVAEFIREKRQVLERYIEDQLRQRGMDVDEILSRGSG